MMTVLSIWTTLDNVKYSIFNEHMEGMSHVAISIAAILAGMSILKNYNGFVKGDGIDFMLIFKPIMILILVANFNTLVMQPLDSVTNIFIRGVTENCSVTNEQYLTSWAKNMETMAVSDIANNIKEYNEKFKLRKLNPEKGAVFEKVAVDELLDDFEQKDRIKYKEVLEAKTAKGGDGELHDDKALQILQKMVKQRKESAEMFTNAGRAELAADEMAQCKVIEQYLPAMLSEEELTVVLREIIAQVGATGPQDMGKVMGVATKQLAGKAEGKAINLKVRELLQQ